jgi:hypothetical protein
MAVTAVERAIAYVAHLATEAIMAQPRTTESRKDIREISIAEVEIVAGSDNKPVERPTVVRTSDQAFWSLIRSCT